MDYTIEKWEDAETGITASLFPDEDFDFDWDLLGDFYVFGLKYGYLTRLSDDTRETREHRWKPEGEPDEIAKEYEKGVLLPLFLYEHGGITIRTSPEHFRAMDAMGWDWGQVGFVGIKPEKIRAEYGLKRISRKARTHAEEVLRGEVESYDQYLTGEVYWYIVEGPDGENLDSCSGFLGFDYARQETQQAFEREVQSFLEARAKEAQEQAAYNALPPYQD